MIRLLMEVSPLYRTEQTRETFHFVATASYINPHKLSVNVSVWEPKNTTKRKNGVTGKHPREKKKKKKNSHVLLLLWRNQSLLLRCLCGFFEDFFLLAIVGLPWES